MKQRVASFSLWLMLTILLTSVAMAVSETEIVASGDCGTDVTWQLSSDGLLTISGTGPMTDFSYTGAPWYSYRANITDVEVKNGVTTIGNYAFSECQNIQSITLSENITAIGASSFSNCKNLLSINLPDNVTTIEGSAFSGCTSLQELSISATLENVGSNAFYNCSALKSIVLPDTVTTIGNGAFSNCYQLISLTLPRSGVTEIGDSVFMNCEKLSSVTLPAGITQIGNRAFYNCFSLTAITIPKGVTKIGDYAFFDCTSLAEISFLGSAPTISSLAFDDVKATCWYIPDSTWTSSVFSNYGGILSWKISSIVANGICGNTLTWTLDSDGVLTITGVGDMTVYALPSSVPWYTYRTSITSVNLPEGLTNIGRNAFYGCSSIESILIPNSVKTIGAEAFFGCTNMTSIAIPASVISIGDGALVTGALKEITLNEDNTDFILKDGVLFSSDMNTLIQYPAASSRTSYIVPNGVTRIGVMSFYGCCNLMEVTFPASITGLHSNSFAQSTNLTKITFTGDIPSISYTSFTGVTATAIYPAGNTSWKENLLQDYGGSLTWISQRGGLCGINLTWILDSNGNLTISGTGEMDDYDLSTLPPWNAYRTSIEKVIIEEGVTSIGSRAFFLCSYLSELSLPDSLTVIGATAFDSCKKLTSFTIPRGLTTLGEGAINTGYLEEIYVATGNTSFVVKDGILYNSDQTVLILCPSMDTHTIYTVLDSVTTLAAKSFWYCENLTQLTLPNSVSDIGNNAFYCCSNLVDITFLGNPPTIAVDAFTKVTATCYYPKENTAWTETILQDYGGDITWVGQAGIVDSGTCGENLIWSLDTDGILTISGTGNMENYSLESPPPWYAYNDDICRAVVENGITSIGHFSFYRCTSLATASLPNSIKSLGDSSFAYCTAMRYCNLPINLETIGKEAFYTCEKLVSINIPTNVTSIGESAFLLCSSLTGFIVDEGNTAFKTDENRVLLDADGSTLLCYPAGKSLASYVIPDSVTEICAKAFTNSHALTEIIFTSSAPAVGSDAFVGVTATVWYPLEDCSWSESVMQNYGGTLSWVGYYGRGICGDDLAWVLDENFTLTISGTGSMYDYHSASGNILPWSTWAEIISKVVVEEGITSVGSYAFEAFPILNSVSLPSTLISIGDHTFDYCQNLSALNLPDSLTVIGEAAFYRSGLTSLAIPGNVKVISSSLFGLCENLESVTLSEGIETIHSFIFDGCNKLKILHIPATVTNISASAFSGCGGLTTLNVAPENPAYCDVDGILFSKDMTQLIRCPENKAVGIYTVPSSVTMIHNSAFRGCIHLTSVTVPASITVIGDQAFYHCLDLTEVVFLGNAPTFGDVVFTLVCATCTYPPNDSTWSKEIRTDYDGELTWVMATNGICGDNLTWAIKDNTLTITGTGTMYDYISGGTPWYSYSLNTTNVVLSEGITSIGRSAFAGLHRVDSITIPSSITYIGNSAFYESSVNEITFLGNAPTIASNAFIGVTATCHYPIGDVTWTSSSIQDYGGTLSWIIAKGYCGNELTWTLDDDGMLTISGTGAMEIATWGDYCSSIKDVFFPDGMTNICNQAFADCEKLTSLTIPDSITSIGANAFQNCTGLTNLYIPSGVMSVGAQAFYNCSHLEKVTINANIQTISEEAFAECTNLVCAEFYGNIPVALENNVFPSDPGFTIYYHCNGAGWTSPIWNGYNTVLIDTAVLDFGSITLPDNAVAYVAMYTIEGKMTGIQSVTVFNGALIEVPGSLCRNMVKAKLFFLDSMSLIPYSESIENKN